MKTVLAEHLWLDHWKRILIPFSGSQNQYAGDYAGTSRRGGMSGVCITVPNVCRIWLNETKAVSTVTLNNLFVFQLPKVKTVLNKLKWTLVHQCQLFCPLMDSDSEIFHSHCCSLFQYIIFRIWSSEYLVTRTLNGLNPIRTVSCSVSHVAALNELNNSFPSFSDFKDYYQCSVTSVLLYQLHTWPSAFWGHMFYNRILSLFSAQAPGWQSKQSHLGDSKHRRQEVWRRNSRPLSIHYLSEINKSFLWPTRRKIRTAFTSCCSEIHQYMSEKQWSLATVDSIWFWRASKFIYISSVGITRNIQSYFHLNVMNREMYLQ